MFRKLQAEAIPPCGSRHDVTQGPSVFDHGATPEVEDVSTSVADLETAFGAPPDATPDVSPRLQPLLHDLVSAVLAPTSALSGADGQIRPVGAQGFFHADSRALSQVRLLVDGREPDHIAHSLTGPGGARFVSCPGGSATPVPTRRCASTASAR